MSTKGRLVIIGNGMAGWRLVEELVTRGATDLFDIVVFDEEPYGNYNRILLSSVLAGGHKPNDIFMKPPEWYAANGIRLHSGARVLQIDRRLRQVFGAGHVVEPYDKLVLATGSSPFVPEFQGLSRDDGCYKEGVFVFRSLDDCRRIVEYAEGARTAAVIGGGLLGLEAARGLMQRGLEVHVVHLMSHLMETQLDETAGAILKQTLEGMGVQVHLEKATTGIRGSDRANGLDFGDGSWLDCDMVVVAAGIRANVALARQAGLSVERGIVVHNDLTCRNDPDVYAIGECAQHRGVTYGLVAPAWEQAQVLADVLTGLNSPANYRGSRVSTKLKVMGIDLAAMGQKEAGGEDDEVVTYVEPSRGVYKKLVVRGERLVGAILLGEGLGAPRLLQAFDRDELLPESRAELLFPLAGDSPGPNVAGLPDHARICHCNGVSKGRIIEAMRSGDLSLKAVGQTTRAGSGCGSCKPEIQALLNAANDHAQDEQSAGNLLVTQH